ncbi:protein of unknown function [Aminobacter niigataensis]|nr:protein of unknown function [Aminobacter niigataensis]
MPHAMEIEFRGIGQKASDVVDKIPLCAASLAFAQRDTPYGKGAVGSRIWDTIRPDCDGS